MPDVAPELPRVAGGALLARLRRTLIGKAPRAARTGYHGIRESGNEKPREIHVRDSLTLLRHTCALAAHVPRPPTKEGRQRFRVPGRARHGLFCGIAEDFPRLPGDTATAGPALAAGSARTLVRTCSTRDRSGAREIFRGVDLGPRKIADVDRARVERSAACRQQTIVDVFVIQVRRPLRDERAQGV